MVGDHSICKFIRTTRFYFYFSLVQLMLTLILLVFIVLYESRFCLVIQIGIAVLLLVDLIIKALSEDHFWGRWPNALDLVFFLILSTVIVLELAFEDFYEVLGEFSSVVLAIRYGIQLFRLVSLIKQSRELKMMHKMSVIQFDGIQINSEDIDIYKQIPEPKLN